VIRPEPEHPGVYDLFLSLVAILALVLVGLTSALEDGSEIEDLVTYLDTIVCVIFLADFVRNLVKAPSRRRYLATWGIVDLASSVPAIGPLRLARLARIIRVFRAIRSLRILANAVRDDRRSAVLAIAMFVTLVTMTGSCIGVLYFEEQAPHANLKQADDVLWWALTTVSTVGYGDFYPVTTGGRFCAAGLMLVGIGLFASLAGILADLLRVLAHQHHVDSHKRP
jgi:voltage-gated potassium channel